MSSSKNTKVYIHQPYHEDQHAIFTRIFLRSLREMYVKPVAMPNEADLILIVPPSKCLVNGTGFIEIDVEGKNKIDVEAEVLKEYVSKGTETLIVAEIDQITGGISVVTAGEIIEEEEKYFIVPSRDMEFIELSNFITPKEDYGKAYGNAVYKPDLNLARVDYWPKKYGNPCGEVSRFPEESVKGNTSGHSEGEMLLLYHHLHKI